MIQIGRQNSLLVARRSPHGLFLTDGEQDVLLPFKHSPKDVGPGETISVFVYKDSEDRLVATTQKPKAQVDEFAPLRCKEVASVGAFFDWGLDKDLLVPHSQMARPVLADRTYVVRILLDDISGRVLGTTRLRPFLASAPGDLPRGTDVEALVYEVGPNGARAIVDGKYDGFLRNETEKPYRVGQRMMAYAHRVHEDGKVEVTLTKRGLKVAFGEGPTILERLKEKGGWLPLSDSSTPEEIRREFNMSKSSFKKAIGMLMKQGEIEITHHGIRLRQ